MSERGAGSGKPNKEGGGCLGLVGLFVGLMAFILGATAVLEQLAGVSGEASEVAPFPYSVLVAVVSFALLDFGVRRMGRKRLTGSLPVHNAEILGRGEERYGSSAKPAPAGVIELAFLPILLLLPALMVVSSAGSDVRGAAVAFMLTLVFGILLSVVPLVGGIYGQSGLALGGVLGWLPWLVFLLGGRLWLSAAVGAVVAVLGLVVTYLVFARLQRDARGSGPPAAGE